MPFEQYRIGRLCRGMCPELTLLLLLRVMLTHACLPHSVHVAAASTMYTLRKVTLSGSRYAHALPNAHASILTCSAQLQDMH